MKSLKGYLEEEKTRQGTELPNETKDAAELTKKIAAAYNGKSNAAMLKNILKEAEKSKRAGTLTNEEIDGFYQTFSPMLNAEQRNRLRSVVERLKTL